MRDGRALTTILLLLGAMVAFLAAYGRNEVKAQQAEVAPYIAAESTIEIDEGRFDVLSHQELSVGERHFSILVLVDTEINQEYILAIDETRSHQTFQLVPAHLTEPE